MAEPIRMKVRDGCRGGKDQFRWNSIKEQDFKDRECYLGQSTKVGMMGKFGHYYLHDWYQQKKSDDIAMESELATVRAYEDELMEEALGRKPKRLLLAKRSFSEEELKEFLKKESESDVKGHESMGPSKKKLKNDLGDNVEAEEDRGNLMGEASTQGLGYAPHRTLKLEEFKARAFGTSGELQGSTFRGKTEEKCILKAEVTKQDLDEVKREPENEESIVGNTLRDEVKQEGRARRDKKDKKDKKRRKEMKKQKKAEKQAKRALKREKKAYRDSHKVSKKQASSSESDSSS